jgi:hypothetical protein
LTVVATLTSSSSVEYGIDPFLLVALAASLDGSVILPVDEQYDEFRMGGSLFTDPRPAVIVKAASNADIRLSIQFAKQFNVPFSVRGTAYGIEGTESADGGVMVDTSHIGILAEMIDAWEAVA